MKKNKIAVLTLSLVALSPIISSCAEEKKPVHEHAFYPVEAKDPTCVSTGNIAYDQCIYCKEIKVGDETKTLEDVTLPIDPTKHAHLEEFEEVPSTCVTEGTKAHSYCEDCKKFIVNGEFVEQESLKLPIDLVNGHSYTHFDEVKATCIDGKKAYDFCSTCNKYFIDGKEVTPEDLVIKANGEHTFEGEDLVCKVCNTAYKYNDTNNENHIFASDNHVDIKALPRGLVYSSTAEDKAAAFVETIANRLHFGVQGEASKTSFSSTLDSISIKNKATSSSFIRFTLGKDKTPYTGKALISFKIKFNEDTVPNRVGLKVVDGTGSIIKGDNVKQDVLLGSKAAEENNASRKFLKNKEYTFIYEVNVTEANQMMQVFSDIGAVELTFSDFHYIPLNKQEENVSSSLLYVGLSDLKENTKPGSKPVDPDIPPVTTKSYKLFNGDNFFDPANWYDSKGATRGSDIIDNGNLVFTSNTTSRYDFFYSVNGKGTDTDKRKHLGDNGKNITNDIDKAMFKQAYRYDFTLSATDAFDIMLLGSSKNSGPSDTKNPSLFLNITKDGKLSLNQSTGIVGCKFSNHFTAQTVFSFTKENKLSIEIHRVSSGNLTLKLYLNDVQIKLSGEAIKVSDSIDFLADETGTFASNGYFAANGMGQRLGIYPSASSKVTISDLKVTPEPNQK